MTSKRMVILYCIFAAAVCVLNFRIAYIMCDAAYALAGEAQRAESIQADLKRPDFYDRNGSPLTGRTIEYRALAVPGDLASYNILGFAEEYPEQLFTEMMRGNEPFLVPVAQRLPSYCLVDCIPVRRRYSDSLFSHLLGYLDGEANGVSGLEYVYDGFLKRNSRTVTIEYTVDAVGRVLPGEDIEILDSGSISEGVQLTVDSRIQTAAAQAAEAYLRKGAVVVLDCESGEILAALSRPDYDPNDVAQYLDDPDGALVNRAMAQYSVGSVYKMLVQAAALEAGIDSSWTYTCTGHIEVGDSVFYCAGGGAHGEVDMKGALAGSCNCYHIALAAELGPDTVRNMALKFGFGSEIELANGYSTAAGYLPTLAELADTGEFTNHSFGQGRLLANPIQLGAYISVFANGGMYTRPSLIRWEGELSGFVYGDAAHESYRVISEKTAAIICDNMEAVMTEGTGAVLAPELVSCAGKTGTAESGVYSPEGETIISTFAGYFPAENPRYVVVVVSEREYSSDKVALRTFSRLCDLLYQAADD